MHPPDEETVGLADFEMVVAALPDPVFVLSGEGRIRYINPAAEALLERSRKNLLDKPVEEVFRSEPWLVAAFERARQDPDAGVRSFGRFGDDHEESSATATALHDRRGRTVGILLVIHRSVRGGWSPPDKNIRARLEDLDALVASVGHELNNPLSGIRGAAQILSRRLSDDPGLAEYAEMIVRQVDRMSALIEKLMTLEAPAPRMQPVNIHRVLDDVVMLARSDAERKGVRIETEFDPSLPEVYGDAGQLQQVFLNLVKNAIAAASTPEGWVQIATRMEHSFYVDTKAGRVRYVAVEVSDNGPGIEAEAVEKIFTPFYSETAGGRGIGLTVARSIVAAHRGQIHVSRHPRGGACFRVSLPVAKSSE